MMNYYYALVKTKLIQDEDSVVLDVPFTLYSQTIREGNKDVTYSGRVVGKNVLAVIAVKNEDEEALKALPMWIGDEWDVVKDKADYKNSYTIKIKDVKRKIDDEGKVTEYTGADKDESARFCMWTEKYKPIEEVIDA